MALVLMQPGIEPLGQYDGYSAILTTIKGGEVVTFSTESTSFGSAADALDGYINPGTSRVCLTNNLGDDWTAGNGPRPLMLVDDGLLHYGTLFGTVVGGTVGTTSYGLNSTVPSSALLGPHTALGSGKWTAWDKPGLYAVTLDACDTTAVNGLQPTNPTLVPGAALYASAHGVLAGQNDGVLSPNSMVTFETSAVVGRFVEFHTDGSLVTTPNRLVSALNSPSSVVGGVLSNTLYMAVFHWAALS